MTGSHASARTHVPYLALLAVVWIVGIGGALLSPSNAVALITMVGSTTAALVAIMQVVAKVHAVQRSVDDAGRVQRAESVRTTDAIAELASTSTDTLAAVNGVHGDVLEALATALEHTAEREQTAATRAAAAAARRAADAHAAKGMKGPA